MPDIDVRAAREALKCAINNVPGLRCHSRMPGAITPPAAVVLRRETRYNPTVDVGCDITFAIRLYLSISNSEGSQDKLDDYLAPTGDYSLRAAIDADPTLDGTVQWAAATSAEAEGLVDVKGIDYISADLIVEVG